MNGIVDPESFPAIRNEFRLAKTREMLGNLRLWYAQRVSEFTHTQFSLFRQKRETSKTNLIGKRVQHKDGFH